MSRSPITDYVIDAGQAQRILLSPPAKLIVVGGRTQSTDGIPPPPDEPPFWWDPRLAWLRAFAYDAFSAYSRLRTRCE